MEQAGISEETVAAIARALRNLGWNIRAGSGERQLKKVLDALLPGVNR